mmetsp:Transcript_103052/g.204572  ORF Transcript_103052/g.204572 Transcript_103052/m.204572 type:complete len:208 (+) Transcript_103052:1067-1690(+)
MPEGSNSPLPHINLSALTSIFQVVLSCGCMPKAFGVNVTRTAPSAEISYVFPLRSSLYTPLMSCNICTAISERRCLDGRSSSADSNSSTRFVMPTELPTMGLASLDCSSFETREPPAGNKRRAAVAGAPRCADLSIASVSCSVGACGKTCLKTTDTRLPSRSSGRIPWVMPSAEKPSMVVTEPRGMRAKYLGAEDFSLQKRLSSKAN